MSLQHYFPGTIGKWDLITSTENEATPFFRLKGKTIDICKQREELDMVMDMGGIFR
jgi:hypothetical protein